MRFKDCMYRRIDKEGVVYCDLKVHDEKTDNSDCDNCTDNPHLNCENYVPRNDMCLKWFQLGVSEVSQYDTCAEKILYDDEDLQRKWSN